MPNYAYPGSESSEHDQSFDKTKDHYTTEESLQQSPRVYDESTKDQSLEGYCSNGYISKTYDPVALSKRPMFQGNTLITVNRLVWMGLPEHIMGGRLGEIEVIIEPV